MRIGRATSAFAGLRVAYALALIASPGRLAGRWLGAAAGSPGGTVAVRGLAARDLVISGAVLVNRGSAPRALLLACAVSDLADVAATMIADPNGLPSQARRGTIALAGGSALIAAALAGLADSD